MLYFNPRPREEGDIRPLIKLCSIAISIHALVKRATGQFTFASRFIFYFNPRPREEGDQVPYQDPPRSAISIHALVKRATYMPLKIFCRFSISIHALVKRATLYIM